MIIDRQPVAEIELSPTASPGGPLWPPRGHGLYFDQHVGGVRRLWLCVHRLVKLVELMACLITIGLGLVQALQARLGQGRNLLNLACARASDGEALLILLLELLA